MKSQRLNAINAFLNKEDNIIDVGCDHAYVAIAQAKKNAKYILATDIHEQALKRAKENIEKNHLSGKIKVQLSDGLNQVDTKPYNTLIIAGMGATTILKILNHPSALKPIQKLIIESNNELSKVRKGIESLGFFLQEETIVYEKKHYYTIMKWERSGTPLTKTEILLGKYRSENHPYYVDCYQENKKILKSIPISHWKERLKKKKILRKLKKYIRQL